LLISKQNPIRRYPARKIRDFSDRLLGGHIALHTNPPGGITQYYRDNVIGGAGAFVVPIEGFASFGDAMLRKLINEVASSAREPPG